MKKELSIEKLDRRKFVLMVGKASASLSFVGASVSTVISCSTGINYKPGSGIRWSNQNTLPNKEDDVIPVPGTRSELTPIEDHYKMIHFGIPPEPNIRDWRLQFNGLIEKPFSLNYEDIRNFETISEFITLTCITNPVGGSLTSTTLWTGVSFQKILPLIKLKDAATHLRIRAADGFFETIAIETILSDERVMLAYEWDGVPLPMAHGFPLRLYIPNRYGMKLPKWITSFTAIDHWEPGYSVKNTWDKEAIVKTTSVIDTIQVDKNGMVCLGGVAHGGSLGISKVEIQVNGGEWQEALLRKPLSSLTWVIWRFDWPFYEGDNEFAVRAYNKNGRLQDTEESSAYPDGATGVFRKKRSM
ncbi:MAG: molybdopterin-dependent oxidoreductase [Flavobacteriaceae bacterium]